MKKYPAIVWVARWGRPGSAVIGVLIVIAGLVPAILDADLVTAIASVISGLVFWGVLRVCAEIVEVVAETLLPR